jgi:integrase
VWCRKIRKRFHYFGKDKDKALEQWLKDKDYLLAGKTPPPEGAGERLTLRDLCNRFLTAKKQLVTAGELSARHFDDLYRACERILRVFGKGMAVEDITPTDFGRLHADVTAALGVYARLSEIARARSVFNFAFKEDLIERPVRFGTLFKKPTPKVMDRERSKNGPKLFTRDELLALLKIARQPIKAMVLLGLNCGFGNSDVAELSWSALDMAAEWATFPRKKTGAPRRAKLWPETVVALKEWQPMRPAPKNEADADLVFVTVRGGRWVKDTVLDPEAKSGTRPAVDGVSREMRRTMKKAKLTHPGVNFYALRHTYRTIADGALDEVAIDYTMGHKRRDMASAYRETAPADERLAKIADHVRQWLFGTKKPPM